MKHTTSISSGVPAAIEHGLPLRRVELGWGTTKDGKLALFATREEWQNVIDALQNGESEFTPVLADIIASHLASLT